ncbi:MAP7 domain-containing protein 3 isoform X3 [Mustela putorius furo]|uniref:MAP7 domain-containing protein 3 isoform X3 n=1 Tax=Mustela putorius furo TaxID=9669 RepID=A0A8U0URV3_MUSPF|nr:MAP7 domain-containing protein 3 isoform X3 [Mustela putorius furo]
MQKVKKKPPNSVAAAHAIAEERRNQSSFSTHPSQSANIRSAFKPVIDGSVLKNDVKQRLAKERREETKRQQEATKETQLLEKERKSRIQYEKQMEEKQRKLKEQKEKDEQRRISAEEKRKQKLQEERERFKAVLCRTLERSNRVDHRQKRWSWEGSTAVNPETKTASKRSVSTEKLEQETSGLQKQMSVSSAGLQSSVAKKNIEKKRSSSLTRRSNKLQAPSETVQVEEKPTARQSYTSLRESNLITRLLVPTKASIARSKSAASLSVPGKDTSGTHSALIQYINMPLRSHSSDELKNTMALRKAAAAGPPQEKVEAPPDVSVEAAPHVKVEATPEATVEAAPEVTVEAASEATVEAASEVTVEAAPEVTVEAAPEATVEAAPEATVEAAPEATVEATPEVTVEAAPEVTVEAAFEATVEAASEVTVEATPKATVEVAPEANAEATPKVSVEGPPEGSVEAPCEAGVEALPESMETSPEVSVDVSPEASVDPSSPEASVDPSSPEVSVDPSPEVSLDSSPEVSMDASPDVSMEASSEASVEASPKASVGVSPEASLDTSPGASVKAFPKESVEASSKASPKVGAEASSKVKVKDSPQKSEMDKQASNPATKKRPPSHIPCYKWPSSPASGWRPPSPISINRQMQKNRPPSPSPVMSKQSQSSLSYKVIPVQRSLLAQNALGSLGKKREGVPKAASSAEAVSPKQMVSEESSNKSTPGTMNAKEATKILAEKRRLAREQREREERIQKEREQSKPKDAAEKAAEVQREEFSKLEDGQQQKEVKEGSPDPEDPNVLLQKGDAKIKAQEEADKRKKEQERIMLQNLQERLERKKRIEEIMKRTRKTDSNTAKAAEPFVDNTYEEDEADDEDESESDDNSFDDLRPSAFINGMDSSTKLKTHFKNMKKNTPKLVFLDATSGQVRRETKTFFNGDMKNSRQKSAKDPLAQAKGTRSPTKRMTSRAANTRKASETCSTVGPSKSLDPEAQEWICDKIIDIRNEAESLMSSTPPDSQKYHPKGSRTFHQSPPLPLDDKKNNSVPAPSDM